MKWNSILDMTEDVTRLSDMRRNWLEKASSFPPVDAQVAFDIAKTIQILIDQIAKYVEDLNDYIRCKKVH